MLDEAVRYLNCGPGGRVYVDCTLGGSGHAKAILDRIRPGGKLIGMDQDSDAIDHAENVLKSYAPDIRLFHGNFIRLPELLRQLHIDAVHGILMDLGLSLHQLEASGRGFSFQKEEPLDMRMDATTGTTAEQLVNTMAENALRRMFREYGEERWSGPIARRIVQERRHRAIRTSSRLSEIICSAIPAKARRTQSIHPATRVFMALRIAVNRELEVLEEFMKAVPSLLKTGGRLCVISFHSLEDRIVKHAIQSMASPCQCPPDFPQCVCGKQATMKAVIRKPLRPSREEIAGNPKARSAKLRVAEKL